MARTRLGAAGWAALIDEWQDSGLSLPAFCERRGLNRGTMQGWVYKRGHRLAVEQARREAHAGRALDEQTPTPTFLPVRLAEPIPIEAAGPGVEVVLGPGRRIVVAPGFDPETLRRVVAVLAGRPC
jgi:transposase